MKIKTYVQGAFSTNCYLLYDTASSQAIVIDPAEEDLELMQFICEMHLSLNMILLTHGHIDHISGAVDLQRQFQARIGMHQADEFLLEAAPEMARLFGLPEPEVPEPDFFFRDEQRLECGAATLKVIHTPGHSPGGVSFVFDEFVFAGDALFAGSIGRTDLPGGNYQKLIQSIKHRLLILDEKLVVYPGHGPETTICIEKLTNPYLL
ncbi:MBL fold metallo-hydrolase [candidate division KSB1 bacterium]|nr:MBL fold metallo-hydrolase [candidate division KSB1 bacterium]